MGMLLLHYMLSAYICHTCCRDVQLNFPERFLGLPRTEGEDSNLSYMYIHVCMACICACVHVQTR